MIRGIFLKGMVLAAAVLLVPATAVAEDAAQEMTVESPYVRAVPPGQPNSAAFMVLRNNGAAPHALVAASSPAAQTVELHTHVNENGMMMMRPVARIDVAAGGETPLQPGGFHVMFIGLTGPLVPDAMVPITLTYEDGSSQTVEAPVRKLQMQMRPMPSGQH